MPHQFANGKCALCGSGQEAAHLFGFPCQGNDQPGAERFDDAPHAAPPSGGKSHWLAGLIIGGIFGGPFGAVLGGFLGSAIGGTKALLGPGGPFTNHETPEGKITGALINHDQAVNGVRGMEVILTCFYDVGGSILPRQERFSLGCLFLNPKGDPIDALRLEFANQDGKAVFGAKEVVNTGLLGLNARGQFQTLVFIPYGALKVRMRKREDRIRTVLRVSLLRESTHTVSAIRHFETEYPILRSPSGATTQPEEAGDDGPFPKMATLALMAVIVSANGRGASLEERNLVSRFYLGDEGREHHEPKLFAEFERAIAAVAREDHTGLAHLIRKASDPLCLRTRTSRVEFAGFLGLLAAADGHTAPEEILRLHTICDALDLSPADQKTVFAGLQAEEPPAVLYAADLFSLVIMLDGQAAAEEVRVVVKFFARAFPGDQERLDSVRANLKSGLRRKIDLDEVTAFLRDHLEKPLLADIYEACLLICVSDGPMNGPEDRLMADIGQKLGFSSPEAEEAKRSVVGSLDDLFTTLGVKPGASLDEVKRAFRERAKTMHPDKLAGMDPEIQRFATQKFQQLQAAYDRLLAMYE